ncbi:hypothetical protein JRC04_04265 [Mycolicibacterium sp. S2-37]|uniref:hypothetical protein n=1 Tax=Mycolicibacterium sp. S2-37 TaxID=2810297 RepID=UPI001A9534F0|nr:hypothetical protein [Mycolicibacterium sp. S2-37]MBO0676677.1 hypothetical protein [Mycolicibacterium sp. S2-37]
MTVDGLNMLRNQRFHPFGELDDLIPDATHLLLVQLLVGLCGHRHHHIALTVEDRSGDRRERTLLDLCHLVG